MRGVDGSLGILSLRGGGGAGAGSGLVKRAVCSLGLLRGRGGLVSGGGISSAVLGVRCGTAAARAWKSAPREVHDCQITDLAGCFHH
jgi:hypothetical protein